MQMQTNNSQIKNPPLYGLATQETNMLLGFFGLITGLGITGFGFITGYYYAKRKYGAQSNNKGIIEKIKSMFGMNNNSNKHKLRIFLIRHVETETINNAPKTFMSPISNNGLDQAHTIGSRLGAAKIKFDIMFSSPTVRTYDTSQVVKEYVDKIKSKNISVSNTLISSNILSRTSKNESYDKIGKRIRKFLENEVYENLSTISSSSDELLVGVFTHGFVIKSLLQNIQNSRIADDKKYQIDNGSITELSFNPKTNEWRVIRINDCAHCEHLIDDDYPDNETI